MKWNWRTLVLKSWHFEASEDIITKFKSHALHVIKIKYWKAGVSSNPPSLIPSLWNIGILLHKQAKRRTIMNTTGRFISIILIVVRHALICGYLGSKVDPNLPYFLTSMMDYYGPPYSVCGNIDSTHLIWTYFHPKRISLLVWPNF